MIMLPLHGQDTAAVEHMCHWAGSIFNIKAENDVFGKQARFIFAEFVYKIFIYRKGVI